MSEKYTIVESLSSENNGACWLFKGDVKIASFNFLVEAELVCRLLNEDEAKKSSPKIDKKFKEWANNELKLTIAHRSMYIDKEQWDENIRNLERLLNIVNSLEIQQ